MYNHPWSGALLGLSIILEDCASTASQGEGQPTVGAASMEALQLEGLSVVNVETLVSGLEEICDVSFR
jgi:hypothetical protein